MFYLPDDFVYLLSDSLGGVRAVAKDEQKREKVDFVSKVSKVTG
jgi:hypothetical protein